MSHILLADDDRAFSLALKEGLEQRSFSVDLVHDGVEAVLRFMERPYACMLLDVRMPRLNGIDALRIIRKFNPRVPVILISGDLESLELDEFLESKETKCLAKPFEMVQLEKEIRSYIPNDAEKDRP